MTHDPMCGFNVDDGAFDFIADSCARCDFIAKVRYDERLKVLDSVLTLLEAAAELGSECCACTAKCNCKEEPS